MGTVVAVANQKGGVAKTTTVAALAGVWADRGRRVLAVDLDPQAALTWSLGVDGDGLVNTVAEVLAGCCAVADAVLELPVATGRLALLAANDRLGVMEQRGGPARPDDGALRSALDPVRDRFDWVIVDCPPSLGWPTTAALVAADEVIVPLQCEALGLRATERLVAAVRAVQAGVNPSLRLRGVLPTMYDKRAFHPRDVLRRVRDELDLPVLGPPVPRSVRVAEAPDLGVPLLVHAGASKPAAAYRSLAKELDRLRRASSQPTRSSKGKGREKK